MHNKTLSIIERFKKIHGNKYDYSKVEYINNRTKVCIICAEHGEFWISPDNILSGKGCKRCGIISAQNKNKMSQEDFLLKAKNIHGLKYDYTYSKYINTDTKIKIICPIHGEFWQRPHHHLNKIGIEYHGRQHFIPISKFGGNEGLKKCKERDYRKYKKCNENGLKLFYLTFEKCDTSEYFTKVYNSLDDLFNEIDKNIKIKITKNDIQEIVYKIINKLLVL